MVHLTRPLLLELYALAIAAGEILDGVELGLYTNSVEIDVDTVIGDLTQPTFTTYALTAVALAAANDAGGEPILIADPAVFSPSNATNLPQSIVGAFLVDAGGALLAAGPFSELVNLTAALQQIHATAKIDISSEQAATFEGNLG